MVYVSTDKGRLNYEGWKKVEREVHRRLLDLEPDDAAFPNTKGFPRVARMAYNAEDCFLACLDPASANWMRPTIGKILADLGLGEAVLSDKARMEGKNPYSVVLPDYALELGPERTAQKLLSTNRWPGKLEYVRGLISPSDPADKRSIVLFYVVPDKEAEEAIVMDGFKGFFGGTEIRFRRKKKDEDGDISVTMEDATTSSSKGQSADAGSASHEGNSASNPTPSTSQQ